MRATWRPVCLALTTSLTLSVAAVAQAQSAQPAAQAPTAESPEAHTDRVVRFKELDRNGDGKITLEEFQNRPNHADIVAGKPTPPPSEKDLADRAVRFKQLDLNHDGFLNYDEFAASMTTPLPAGVGGGERPAGAAPFDAKDFRGVWILTGGGGGGGDLFNSRPQTEWSADKLPFTAKGRAQFEGNKPGKGPRQVPIPQRNDPIGQANPMGLYRTLIYSRPIEIVQTQEQVVQLFAWGRIFRIIYTDGRPVPKDVPQGPYWYGHTVGKWEGDTLVATTLALDGRAWMDEWGTPLSDDARIEERWTRTAADRLQLVITVTDPALYSKPWSSVPVIYRLQKGVDPDEIILAPVDEQAFDETVRDPAGGAKKN